MFYNSPMCKKVQISRGPEIPCNQKQPAGPETVLVKTLVFIKMSVALWRNDDFCIASNPKFWIHFLDVFAFYHSASSFSSDHVTLGILQFFLRRCVSRSPRFSSANWHESWCTSIASFCSETSNRGCEKTNFWECSLLMLTMLLRRTVACWKLQDEGWCVGS